MKLTGTKKEIFESAIELFSLYSFETVSLKNIADAIGKRQGGIYNHFSSKQELLDTIYDFFCEHFFDNRLSFEDIKPTIEKGTVVDIIRSVIYDFAPENADNMVKIMRIIHQRKYSDEKARQIARVYLFEKGIEYSEKIFNYAVQVGRLAPFDTHCLSVFCNNMRRSIYTHWTVDPTPECYRRLVQEEHRLYEYASMLITDLKK